MPQFKLPDDLYVYQKEDASRIAGENPISPNWMNFSEMGVGKTPITLQAIEHNEYRLPLIVCPNSIRFEWRRQIEDWTHEEAAVSKQDPYRRLGDIVRSVRDINGAKYHVINYETLRSVDHARTLGIIPFDVIVFDEIHKLRNPDPSKLKKIVKAVWEFLDHYPDTKIIGLSGSPIMNYPNDLYGPLSIGFPDQYPRDPKALRNFMRQYCLFSTGRRGPYIYGSRNVTALKRETEPFTIRRTKKEVLPYLPEKYYRRPELEMGSDQRKLYDDMEKSLRVLLDTGEPLWSTTVLSTLTRLRQINLDPRILGITASSAKTEFLIDLVTSTDEKIVIFSCFERYIDFLSKYLSDLKVNHAVITGQIPPDRRSLEVKKFQEQDDCQVCLGTIQTMGEGITLTASSTVVLADRWWNEPTNQQAIDRLHRIGQKNAVQIILPICSKSVDATLDHVLQRKHDATQAYLAETEVRGDVLSSLGF